MSDDLQQRDEIKAAIDGLRQEERFFRQIRERLEAAEGMSDVASVYNMLTEWETGEYPAHGSETWAMVRMKDLFKKRGAWDEEHNCPDYDEL